MNYLDYHRCRKRRGDDYKPCEFFKWTYKTICPQFWVKSTFTSWWGGGGIVLGRNGFGVEFFPGVTSNSHSVFQYKNWDRQRSEGIFAGQIWIDKVEPLEE